jgi:hypothetical protein
VSVRASGRQRWLPRFHGEKRHVGLVAIQAVALKAGDFLQPASAFQVACQLDGGGVGASHDFSDAVGRHQRLLEQAVEQLEGLGAFHHGAAMRFAQVHDVGGGAGGGTGGLAHAAQKELEPLLPMTVVADGGEAVVILDPVALEEHRQVQQRARQGLLLAQDERDQQASDAAIAIEKRVDGFKLGMGQAAANQQRHGGFAFVQEFFERAQGVHQLVRRWRYERRVGQCAACRANPVLGGAEFARWFFPAPHVLHQLAVNFAHQSQAQGQLTQATQPVVHGTNVVDDLFHVFRSVIAGALRLEGQHVFQRALRAFYLG